MPRHFAVFFLVLALSAIGFSQQADPSLLTLDRIFASNDFESQGIGAVRWLRSGDAYTKLEPSASGKAGRDLVSYGAATGEKKILCLPID